MKRIPWTREEDEWIQENYAQANGGFNPRDVEADTLNRKFHNGNPVRNSQSLARRECKVLNTSLDNIHGE